MLVKKSMCAAALGMVWTMGLLAQAPAIEWHRCLGGAEKEDPWNVLQTSDGGYLAVGRTASADGDVEGWHEAYVSGIPIADLWVVKLDASGTMEWQRALGSTGHEFISAVRELEEGGYFLLAATTGNDWDVSGHHGNEDLWAVRLSATGDVLDEHCLGGSFGESQALDIENQYMRHHLEVAEGGWSAITSTFSLDGDVVGAHGPINRNDAWVVKLDEAANIVWQQTLGGSEYEWPMAQDWTTDGKLVVAISATSDDGEVEGAHGAGDVWVVKMDADGSVLWARAYGGTADDGPYDMQATGDGGCIIAAVTASTDGDVSGPHGEFDWWILKLDPAGDIEWQHALGGEGREMSPSVQQLPDGSYMICGTTTSQDGGDVSGSHVLADGQRDMWVVRLNASGGIVWSRCVGGTARDDPRGFELTPDGGCIIHGRTNSADGDVTGHQGGRDGWLVRIGPTGLLEWQVALGSTEDDAIRSLTRTHDGGYMALLEVEAGDGMVTGAGYHAETDFWMVKLASDGTGVRERTLTSLYVTPSPAADHVRIVTPEPVADAVLSLTDGLGREVMRTMMNSTELTLDVRELSRGMYQLTLMAPGVSGRHRVVLE